MRSKEVDRAINNLNFIVVTDIYDNEVSIDKTKVINEYNQSLGIALDYIRKLEQLPNRIRDKIKECEKHKEEYEQEYGHCPDEDYFFDMNAIDREINVLKSIIGE